MSCECEGITCPCGIPCSCPASPCGCTDCRNSAKRLCQLCWQPINPSSKENACECFMVDSDTGLSQQRSTADSSIPTQLETRSPAQVTEARADPRQTRDSRAKVQEGSANEVRKDLGVQAKGVTTTKASAEVREGHGARVTTESGTEVREGHGARVTTGSGTEVREGPGARVTTGSGTEFAEVSSNIGREDSSVQEGGVDSASLLGAESAAQANEDPSSQGYKLCQVCGINFYIVPAVRIIPNVCLQCSGLGDPLVPRIPSSVNPMGSISSRNLLVNHLVTHPFENLNQQTSAAHTPELSVQFVEQLNDETSLENMEDFINDWLLKTKLDPYRKDKI